MTINYRAPKVIIIVLHFGNVTLLIDCLKSIQSLSYSNFEILIVHNNVQNPRLIESLSPYSEKISSLIVTEKNLGYSKANNIGIKQALAKGAEYVLLLNDDTIASKDFLGPLVENAENDNKIGITGPVIFPFFPEGSCSRYTASSPASPRVV